MHAFKNSNVTSSNGNGNPADGIEKYSKNMLNSYYLQDRVMVKQQCLFGTLFTTKVPGRHFLVSESWRKGVKMTEPNRQSGENEERITAYKKRIVECIGWKNLRDNMSTMEVVLNMLAEATTTELSKAHQPEDSEYYLWRCEKQYL